MAKNSVGAGVLSSLMDASDQTLSLTDCPNGDVLMVPIEHFMIMTPKDVQHYIKNSGDSGNFVRVR